MKKLVKLLCACALTFTLVACGSTSTKNEPTAVEKFAQSDDMKSQMESLNSTFESMGLSVSVDAEGETLIYKYKYLSQVEFSEEQIDSLKESLKAQKSVYDSILTSLKDEVGSENPKVTLQYYNADDSFICEYTFE